jgi:hypothetical protein
MRCLTCQEYRVPGTTPTPGFTVAAVAPAAGVYAQADVDHHQRQARAADPRRGPARVRGPQRGGLKADRGHRVPPDLDSAGPCNTLDMKRAANACGALDMEDLRVECKPYS